jgi:hypothetical protein
VKLVDDNGDERASVHEAVLIKYEWFAKNLERHSYTEDGYTRLVLPGIRPLAYQELVHWLYTGKLSTRYEDLRNPMNDDDFLLELEDIYDTALKKDMADLQACAAHTLLDLVRSYDRQWSIMVWLTTESVLDRSTKRAAMKVIADAIRRNGWERYSPANMDAQDYLNSNASFAIELMALVADSQVLRESEQE